MSSAVIPAPRAQEKYRSLVEQKTYISPFFDFPKQGNIPGISDRTFFGGCGPGKLLLSSFPVRFIDEKTTAMRSTTLKYQVS